MKRRLAWLAAGVAAALMIAAGGGLLLLRTEWFREQLRRRVAAELVKATGARVELRELWFDPRRWHVRLAGLTLRGTEPAGRPPLAQIEAVEVDLRLASFLRREIDLAALRLVRPRVHLMVAADGSTNLPRPPAASGRKPFTQVLLDLEVGRFELRDGELWWNDRPHGLKAAMHKLRAEVRFAPPGAYEGLIAAARPELAMPAGLPPVELVETRFRLSRDRIEIAGFSARTRHSELRFQGAVSNLAQPRLLFQYEAAVDAREINSPWLRGGRIEAAGALEAASGDWRSTGRLSGKQLELAHARFRLRGAAARGAYTIHGQQAEMSDLRVEALGGRWSGRLRATRREIEAAGRLEGVRLESLAAALSTPERPLDQLGWTGTLSGPVELRSSWPPSARATLLAGDVRCDPGSVEGRARFSYDGKRSELELAEVRLATGATSLVSVGRLAERGDSTVRFRLRTSRLDEVSGIVFAFSGSKTEAPLTLRKDVQVQGRLAGTLARPRLSAAVDLGPFVYEGRSWDSFSGRVEWSRDWARVSGGRLAKGRAAISVNARLGLEDGKLTGRSPIEAEIGLRDLGLDDLSALAGTRWPVRGAATAQFRVKGSRDAPRGAGWVELRRGALWDEPFDSLRASVVADRQEVRASNIHLAKGKGSVSGNGAFHPERKAFRFDARGERVRLARANWEGEANFSFTGSGQLDAQSRLKTLAGQGTVRLAGLTAGGRRIGGLSATVRAEEDKVHLEVESDLLGSRTRGEGELSLRPPFAVSGRAQFERLDLGAVMRAAGVEGPRIEGTADGTLTVSGPAERPPALAVQGTVARLELRLPAGSAQQPRILHSVAPLAWRLSERKLAVDQMHLVGEGSDLRATGMVDLARGGAVQASINGSVNLSVIGTFDPKVETAGLAAVNVTVGGTWRDPNLSGRLEVRDGSLAVEDAPLGLTRANGIITFNRRRATIQKLTAETGGGQVMFTGDAELGAGLITYRLRADVRNVRLRYPGQPGRGRVEAGGLSTLLDGRIALTGANKRGRLEGEIEITRASTRSSVDIAALLEALKEPPRTPSANDWLQGVSLNISIVSSPNIRFETTIARNVQADVNLRLRGTFLNPALLGRINITQGEVEFQGTRYTVNRGDISFANPFRIEPVLNLDLETRVSGYDILLTLIGPLQRLNVTYRSDPPLTFNELVTLLAVGRAPSVDPTLTAQQTSQARALSQIGADTIIGEAITRPVTGRLQRFFGVSRLKLDPELVGPEGTATARITIEQQVGRDVTFTYTYNLASAQEQIVRVRWAVSREWSLEAVRDQNGLVGLDILYKKRFR